MPRARRHPLTSAVRRVLPRPIAPTSRRFLALLDRRLAALAAGRTMADSESDRALARRFLAPRLSRWDDGDEDLVRSHLDRWRTSGSPDARRALLEAASVLVRIAARPGTLWFFLWEMESVLDGLPPRDAERGRG